MGNSRCLGPLVLHATLVDYQTRFFQIDVCLKESSRMRLVTALRNGAGFGVSLVTESDIGVNFSGLTYRELRDGFGPSRVGFSAH